MKKKLQFIVFGFVAVFLFAGVGMAQDIQLQTNENPAPAPAEANEKEDGEWLGYYDQETVGGNGLGLNSEGLFDVAIRWESADLADYDGWEITKIRVYMGDEPTSASAKIWQGPDEASLDLKVEEEMTIEEEDWVEVSFDGYEIDIDHELWVGWEVGDPGEGFFPAGMDSDDSEEHDGYANLVNLGEGWDVLSDYDIPGNFVVEAYVEPADGGNGDEDMHTVTLNVDMTDAVAVGDVAFDPDNHDVWVTGTFADWAEPGENPDFQMEPANVAKDANGEMLYPGNWDEDTEGVLGHWAEDGGPIFGTNTYNDAGYGQIFEIDEEYHIDAAKFWIGSVAGEAGDVVFTIWDYSDGSVGDVLGDKTIPLADISASDNLEDAFTVQFDEPVHVVGDFLIGADISDLNAYDPDVYELANIHSDFDTGGEAGLALV
ncbi:MAG: hypothetical protein ACQESL_06020, partial [Bacteroidota bacterium]